MSNLSKKHDWFGARVNNTGDEYAETHEEDEIEFHVWKNPYNDFMYLITPNKRVPEGIEGLSSNSWIFLRKFAETGKPRVGFSEKDAKNDIKQKGYHVVNVRVRTEITKDR